MLIYNTTLNCLEYYNGAWLTIAAGGAANWYNGSGAPSSSIGNNGDYYLNLANGVIYQKSAGSWAVIYSLSAAYAPLASATFTGNIQIQRSHVLRVDARTASLRDPARCFEPNWSMGLLHWNTTGRFCGGLPIPAWAVDLEPALIGIALVDGQKSAAASYVAINGSK